MTCPRCKHPLQLHAAGHSSPAGDDGTQGKHGFICLEYWGCGCWLDMWPVEQPGLFDSLPQAGRL